MSVNNGSNIVASISSEVEVKNDTGNALPVSATTTANSATNPILAQLTDGAATYTGAKTGQLPTALVGGRFDINIGASAATVTVDTELPAAAALSDALANPTTPQIGANRLLWDATGAQWVRGTAQKAGQVSATQSAAGAAVVAAPGNWTAVHFPATAAQATAAKTAGAAGVRHVCTSITVSFSQPTATPVAFTDSVVLRDGTTGAGTVLWRAAFACPATASEMRSITLSGLSIVGSAATAMTLEYVTAGGTATQQSATLTGYSIGA